eukprot:gene4292-4712_t
MAEEKALCREVIYGVPLDEVEFFTQHIPAELIYPISASYYAPCPAGLEATSPVLAEDDFDDVVEILAEVSDEEYDHPDCPAVTASPVTATTSVHHLPVAAAQAKSPILTYAIAEDCFMKEGVEVEPWDCCFEDGKGVVLAEPHFYPPADFKLLPDTITAMPEKKSTTIQDKFYWQQSKPRTGGGKMDSSARPKRSKKKAETATSSSTSTSTAVTAAGSSSISARQLATAKRERENGKFKKARTKWVTVTELFKSTASAGAGAGHLL